MSKAYDATWHPEEKLKSKPVARIQGDPIHNDYGEISDPCINGVPLQEYVQAIQKKYPEEDKPSMVENPQHYMIFPEHNLQVRDIMKVLCGKLDKKGHSAFFASDYVQAMQYFFRFMEKNGKEDLEKGVWYMNRLLDSYNKEQL